MAFTKSLLKISHAFLRPKLHSLVPANEVRTSAVLGDWGHWSTLWKVPKPEFDEKGELGYPEEIDLATGMHKKELLARAAGNDDPYDVAPYHIGNRGTKLDPVMIPSSLPSRLIACECHEDAFEWIRMWIHQGEPQRCACGYWFLLYYQEPFVTCEIPT